MNDEREVATKLEAVAELIKDLIILEAMKIGISGGAIRRFLSVDMNRVTQVSKMLKAAKKNRHAQEPKE